MCLQSKQQLWDTMLRSGTVPPADGKFLHSRVCAALSGTMAIHAPTMPAAAAAPGSPSAFRLLRDWLAEGWFGAGMSARLLKACVDKLAGRDAGTGPVRIGS